MEGTVLKMRSKTIVWAYLLVLSLGTILSLYIPKNEVVAKESVIIPGDAIRLRILANSDTNADQSLKRDVRDAVNAKITLWVKDLTSKDQAKKVIKAHLPEIEKIAEQVVHDEGSTQTVHVKFGKVQFPTKLYGEFLYPAGTYQAVLITLGEGKGANWWCVLYPPLCFLDFSNGVAVSDGFEEEKKAKAAEAPKADEQVKPKAQAVTKPKVETKKQVQSQEKSQVKPAPVEKQESAQVEKQEAEPADQVTESAEKPPVYTSQDDEPVKVKFFIVELFEKLFD
jgi:stage II sporulation protein R